MGNRAAGRRILFGVYVGFAVVTAFLAPRFTGIFIFVGFVILARIGNLNKIEAVYNYKPQEDKNSLRGQHLYSQQYSMKKDPSHFTVEDKPLSEAERNVLYGRNSN
ncbi:MAG: hypothetical protein E7186_02595 [Erysipelotrichaceae bacterium]|nr:hypothetical protein [Erysipelotrichaceae bacterium]